MGTLAGTHGTGGEREPTGDGDRFAAARAALERERDVLNAEIEAFESFADRVDALSTTTHRAAATGPYTDPLADRGAERDRSGARVREAYAETVMAVPHYDREYGEPYATNLAAEFGPALAAALRDEPGLPAFLQQQLVAAARDAAENRTQTIDAIDAEAAALDEGEAVLDAVETDRRVVDSRPFGSCERVELERLHDDLDDLAARCESLAASRQAGDLRPRQVPDSFDAPSFEEYLYADLDATYPVLRAVATTSERIERTRAAVERALATA